MEIIKELDKIASEIEAENPVIALAIDEISDTIEKVAAEEELVTEPAEPEDTEPIRNLQAGHSMVIEYEEKSHYGNAPLVYVTSEHKEPLARLTGKKTLTHPDIEALKTLGYTFKKKENHGSI